MAKQKFPEAEARLFSRVFICMKCGARMKADASKVKTGKVKCRKCRRKQFRPIKKERKTV
jgi:ribosomal protein L40E